MDKVVKIRDINPHIVCSLCAGYFIDATTITECLHTFCRRCIVKYLQVSKYCPTCNLKIHETQPLLSLRLDRTMQDIVFKVVPNIFEDEEAREKAFYEERGVPAPKKEAEDSESEEEILSPLRNDLTEYRNSFKDDELVSLCLKPYSSHEENGAKLPTLPRQYLRCSQRALVVHLQKLLGKKLNVPNGQLQFLCNDEIVNPSSSMKFIWIVHWRRKEAPMNLYYRTSPLKPYEDLAQNQGSTCSS